MAAKTARTCADYNHLYLYIYGRGRSHHDPIVIISYKHTIPILTGNDTDDWSTPNPYAHVHIHIMRACMIYDASLSSAIHHPWWNDDWMDRYFSTFEPRPHTLHRRNDMPKDTRMTCMDACVFVCLFSFNLKVVVSEFLDVAECMRSVSRALLSRCRRLIADRWTARAALPRGLPPLSLVPIQNSWVYYFLGVQALWCKCSESGLNWVGAVVCTRSYLPSWVWNNTIEILTHLSSGLFQVVLSIFGPDHSSINFEKNFRNRNLNFIGDFKEFLFFYFFW